METNEDFLKLWQDWNHQHEQKKWSAPSAPWYPQPCPTCGKCPTCGRGGVQDLRPYWS